MNPNESEKKEKEESRAKKWRRTTTSKTDSVHVGKRQAYM